MSSANATWRLLECPPRSGAWNMAVDAALLESAEAMGRATVRFYAWEEPTLSLGYFQDYASRALHAASGACPIVRRATGGGAIMHDRELTYSFTAPAGERGASATRDLYRLFHGALVEALAAWGLTATMLPARSATAPPRPAPLAGGGSAAHPSLVAEPFLCFQRRAEGDVLLGEHKVAGSAQRRRRNALLQHGSVLLSRSAAAPELPGLAEIASPRIAPGALAAAWLERLAHCAGIAWERASLTRAEQDRADHWAATVYDAEAWTHRR